MFWSKSLVFIHIPKSAGTSIKSILLKSDSESGTPQDVPTHITYSGFQKDYPSLILPDQDSFCVVRNPFKRLFSLYKFVNRDSKLIKYYGREKLKYYTKLYKTFDSFLDNLSHEGLNWYRDLDHKTPQSTWASGTKNQFKIEEPDSIEEYLSKVGGYNRPIPHLNKRIVYNGKDKVTDLSPFYTKFSKSWVEEYHGKDIEMYKYNFPAN